MTTKEKLLQEFGCAIDAVLGDGADEEYGIENLDKSLLIGIANKVAFYLDLD